MAPLTMHVANFDGPCGLCDVRIHEGDDIARVDDEWVHADCAEDAGYDVSRPAQS